jgi:hypothetical protein
VYIPNYITQPRTSRQHLTIADVCRGIAEGDIPARQLGHWYALQKRDVVDYAARCLPTSHGSAGITTAH